MPSRDKFLLMALAYAKDNSLSPVQMQKAMFLLEQEAASQVGDDFYHFSPYNYGPFSSLIYDDVGSLAESGDVIIERIPGRSWSNYRITANGYSKATAAITEVDPRMAEYIKNVVTWIKSLSFSELLSAIYSKYPAYAVNSVFSGR